MKSIVNKFGITFAAAGLLSIPVLAQAAPITVSNVYQFLDNRSVNSIGITDGLRQQFGATNVLPNGRATADDSSQFAWHERGAQ